MFDSKASVVEKYDPITVDCVQERRMIDGREMSSDQGNKAAVVVNNYLYVVSSTKVEKFDNLSLSWEKIAKGTSLALGTNGGKDGPLSCNKIEIIDSFNRQKLDHYVRTTV